MSESDSEISYESDSPPEHESSPSSPSLLSSLSSSESWPSSSDIFSPTQQLLPSESKESLKRVSQSHDARRALEMKHCQNAAFHDISSRPPSTSILCPNTTPGKEKLFDMVRLKPGMNVRIWKLLLPDNTAFHLVAEIVPFQKDAPSYTIGMVFDNRYLQKPTSGLLHWINKVAGKINTPDTLFDARLLHQKRHDVDGSAKFLELAATGLLTEKHIKTMRSLMMSSRVQKSHTSTTVSDNLKIPFVYSMVNSSIVTHYRMLASANISEYPVKGVFNCTSFIMYLFPDIVACGNFFMIADPSRCKALGVVDPSFAGCDARGLTLSERDIHRIVRRQMKETAINNKTPEGRAINKNKLTILNEYVKKKRSSLPVHQSPLKAKKQRMVERIPIGDM
jgi:hypothetical protein